MREIAMNTKPPHDPITAVDPLAGRKHVTPPEANRLIEAAGKSGRQGKRDKLICLLLYRHGLRVSELCDLRWPDFDFEATTGATLTVRRLKHSDSSTHTLDRDEVLMLRSWRAKQGPGSIHLFLSERGAPLSVDMVQRIVKRAGEVAGLGPNGHPHMLRHGAGYCLAAQGADILDIAAHLGHKFIQNSKLYIALSPARLAAVRVR
jgi:integrase